VRPLTPYVLLTCMPRLQRSEAELYVPHLNFAMDEAAVNTTLRAAAFLAQLAHESGQLRYWTEFASGQAYEGRKSLGNTLAGDGSRFKGRGPIQLTGRANYRTAGQALGVDLESNPRLAATPEVGFRVAGWFWRSHGLNELADIGDMRTITKRINGGLSGLADRLHHYQRARAALDGWNSLG
jgi:predicted chitinase